MSLRTSSSSILAEISCLQTYRAMVMSKSNMHEGLLQVAVGGADLSHDMVAVKGLHQSSKFKKKKKKNTTREMATNRLRLCSYV